MNPKATLTIVGIITLCVIGFYTYKNIEENNQFTALKNKFYDKKEELQTLRHKSIETKSRIDKEYILVNNYRINIDKDEMTLRNLQDKLNTYRNQLLYSTKEEERTKSMDEKSFNSKKEISLSKLESMNERSVRILITELKTEIQKLDEEKNAKEILLGTKYGRISYNSYSLEETKLYNRLREKENIKTAMENVISRFKEKELAYNTNKDATIRVYRNGQSVEKRQWGFGEQQTQKKIIDDERLKSQQEYARLRRQLQDIEKIEAEEKEEMKNQINALDEEINLAKAKLKKVEDEEKKRILKGIKEIDNKEFTSDDSDKNKQFLESLNNNPEITELKNDIESLTKKIQEQKELLKKAEENIVSYEKEFNILDEKKILLMDELNTIRNSAPKGKSLEKI